MDVPSVLVFLSPFLVLVVAYSAVVIVALCQADSADVPTVMKDSLKVFMGLTNKLPTRDDVKADRPERVGSLADEDVRAEETE